MTAFIDFTGRAAPVPIDATLQLTYVIPMHENAAVALGGGPAVNRSGLTTVLIKSGFIDGATIGALPPYPSLVSNGITTIDPAQHIGVDVMTGRALNNLAKENTTAVVKDA
jgi:hypothetical protein